MQITGRPQPRVRQSAQIVSSEVYASMSDVLEELSVRRLDYTRRHTGRFPWIYSQ